MKSNLTKALHQKYSPDSIIWKSPKTSNKPSINLITTLTDEGVDKNIDFLKPFIVWTIYKRSGKWYDTYARNLTKEEILLLKDNYFELEESLSKEIKGDVILMRGYNIQEFLHKIYFNV